mmetsp:Transcript_5557/g.12127  ORF Transcript_5557/g.12127 Transcript_5557/m.12127 type:complete len:717 (-) Transcript_5557:2060-4210(-)
MAFSFGSTPAPAAQGAPTPAPGGFSFGGTPAAPAPSTGGFSFGGASSSSTTPAPAGGSLFGSTPAPAPTGGGSFGSAAPAPSGGLFGSTPAPAPSTGGLFGSSTPAPAAGGIFGSTPAPASGGLFGSTPAPSTGGLFGSSAPAPSTGGGLFGTPAPATQQSFAPQQPAVQLSGNTPYSQLPDNAKKAIDSIYQLMMEHRRTIATVKTMAPSLLIVDDMDDADSATADGRTSPSSPADAAAGFRRRNSSKKVVDPSSAPLPNQMAALQAQINTLLQSVESNLLEAQQLKAYTGEAVTQAKLHGAWPIESIAARNGVALSGLKQLAGDGSSSSNAWNALGSSAVPASTLNTSGMNNVDAAALQFIMDRRAASVDRIETMPSPYFLELLQNFEQRLETVYRDLEAVRSRVAIAEEAERVQSMGSMGLRGDETSLILSGGDDYAAMTSLMLYDGAGAGPAPLYNQLASLARSQYDHFLRIAAQAARAHEGLEEVKLRYQRFCITTQGYYDDPFRKADTEEVSREREMQQKIMEKQFASAGAAAASTAAAPGAAPTPASGGGLFGATPAPASGGGLFGAAPAPASGGGLFGSTPAPATGGGLFGSNTASSTGGLFGSNPAPAPSAGGLFGAPAPTAAAPAPSTGGLFGTTTPAPATGGLFGSNPAPAPTGGQFGSSAAPAPAAGTSLFGAPAAGGLFSAPTTPASTLAPRKKSGGRSGRRK